MLSGWGGKEHNKYGRTKVVWPDGRTTVERGHRLAFMIEHKILRDGMPVVNAQGKKLEVSHLCHNGLCVKAAHLALESHEINMEKVLCKSRRQCSTLHEPFCLFLGKFNPFMPSVTFCWTQENSAQKTVLRSSGANLIMRRLIGVYRKNPKNSDTKQKLR